MLTLILNTKLFFKSISVDLKASYTALNLKISMVLFNIEKIQLYPFLNSFCNRFLRRPAGRVNIL